MTSAEVNIRIAALEKELATLPIGYLVLKRIKGKEQPYRRLLICWE